MPAAAAAAAAAISSAAASFSLANFLVSTAISMALKAVGSAMFGKKPKSPDMGSFERGIQDVIRSPISAHRVIYGAMRVGGVIAYATTGGSGNINLHMLVVFASHECEAVQTIWLDDYELPALGAGGWVTSGRYANKVRVKIHLGSPDQVADADLLAEVPEWTEEHRLRGRAYAYVKMVFDQDKFPTGIPDPRFLVKGKKDIYDPRSDTSGWTANWALCVADFIKSDYGVAAEDDELDEDNIIEQANICDELVEIDDEENTQKRYELNGVVYSDDQPIETLEKMMTAAAGAPVWTKGKYYLYAGAYRAPTITLTADDFIGEFKVTPELPRQDLFNRVRGTFINPDNYWQPSDLPVVENATYVLNDGGEEITEDLELPFTTNVIMGQRLLKIHLEKTRLGLHISALANFKAVNLAVMHTVTLNLPQLGMINKVFLVIEWREDPTGGIFLRLHEEAAAAYDWNHGDATTIDIAPNASFPDIFDVANPTAFAVSTVSFLTDTGTTISRMLYTWDAPEDGFVLSGGQIEVQFKRSDEEEWEPSWYVPGNVTQASTPPVEDAVNYDARIRSVNRLKVRPKNEDDEEVWQTIFGYTVGAEAAGATGQIDYRFVDEAANILIDRGPVGEDPDKFLDYGDLNL